MELCGDGLANGQTYNFSAVATDTAGNTATATLATATVDSETPAVAIASAGGLTASASQTISGTVTETTEADVVGSTVSLYDNGSATALATATVQANGTWTAVATLSAGVNSIVADDTDLAGNIGASTPVVYTIASLAQPTITSATYTGSAATGHWNLGGTASAGTTITISDGVTALGTTSATATGTWTFATTENNSAIRDYAVISTASGATSLASAATYEGTPGNDVFGFASEASLSAAALINGGAGTDTLQMTAACEPRRC